MVDYPKASWKPSQFYNTPKAPRVVRAVIIHTAECNETSSAAENVAHWFTDPRAKVSAHYTCDNDSVVQSVLERNIAWHASQANPWSIGIELAGRASQTAAQWADAYSLATLDNAARLVADVCVRHDIPIVWLTPEQLKAGRRGIAGHVDVAAAFNGGKGHWDPGPGFGREAFLELVAQYAGAPAA